jgi:hypothetical protein
MIHFMKNISIAGGFLQVVVLGAASFTLDARFSQGKQGAVGARAWRAERQSSAAWWMPDRESIFAQLPYRKPS